MHRDIGLMTHPNNILYCVHTDEKTTERMTILTIWEGPRMQRFERASALRYFLVFFWGGGFLVFTSFYFLRKCSLYIGIIEFANIKNSGENTEWRISPCH
jgi:hypothetical protein